MNEGMEKVTESGVKEGSGTGEEYRLSPVADLKKEKTFDANVSTFQCFSSTIDSIRRFKSLDTITLEKPLLPPPDSDFEESCYLEESRKSLKTAWKGPPVLHKLKPSLRKKRFTRFLSRETSPEHEIMHGFLSGLKQSALKLKMVKSQATFPLTAVPQRSTLVHSRSSVSAQVSPSGAKSLYHMLR